MLSLSQLLQESPYSINIMFSLSLSQKTSKTKQNTINQNISALRRLRQEEYSFQVSLDYMVRPVSSKIKKGKPNQVK